MDKLGLQVCSTLGTEVAGYVVYPTTLWAFCDRYRVLRVRCSFTVRLNPVTIMMMVLMVTVVLTIVFLMMSTVVSSAKQLSKKV